MSRLEAALHQLEQTTLTTGRAGPLHGIDPRARFIVTVLYLVAMLSVPLVQLPHLLLFALFPILQASAGGIPYGVLLRRSLFVLPLLAAIAIFNLWSDRETVFHIGTVGITRGMITFLAILLRGLLSVQVLLLLILTTGFQHLCLALQQGCIPSLFATQLLLLYRYVHLLLEEMLALERASEARSFGRRRPLRLWARLVVSLLVRTFERADRISCAMAARGFRGEMPLSAPLGVWHRRDWRHLLLWSTLLLMLRLLHPDRLFNLLFP